MGIEMKEVFGVCVLVTFFILSGIEKASSVGFRNGLYWTIALLDEQIQHIMLE